MLTIEQRLEHLEDEAAIRDLVARFADAATRADYETVRSLFKPDAVFTIGEPFATTSTRGVDEIVALIHKLRDGKDFFVEFVHSGLVQLDGNTASARWLVREVGMGPGKNGSGKSYYNNFGFFIDELEKVDGEWLFKTRAYPYVYLDTDPFPGNAVALKSPVIEPSGKRAAGENARCQTFGMAALRSQALILTILSPWLPLKLSPTSLMPTASRTSHAGRGFDEVYAFMTDMTDIIVPPYHVQSTALRLKHGFPYFAHHESISSLWAQKWRPPCEHGIYPFSDGNVLDFDPIFQELIKLSGDSSDILFRPDDYASAFFPAAEHLVKSAEKSEEEGETAKARDLYLRAAAVYRIARFPINRSQLTQLAWERGKAAYLKGGRYLSPPNIAVEIAFTHADISAGDRNVAIQAYLRIPKGEMPSKGWPVLLFICGLDAYKTDNTSRTQIHADRGFATLSFEIPGTGDCPAAPNDQTSPDRLMSSVLDWVHSNASEYGFNIARIVARGISTGGYYAIRIAHTHAEHLFAVAAQGGSCHHMFDAAWIRAQNQMEYPFGLADAIAYKFGYRGPDPVGAYTADAGKFSLLKGGLLNKRSCRLLLINGMEDSIFPIEDNFIVARHGVNKDLLARGNRSHMGDPGGEGILCTWLDEVIAGMP